MSTSAGLLLPLLKDAGEGSTEFGQLIMTAAALAEIVPILLLSLLFSADCEDAGRPGGVAGDLPGPAGADRAGGGPGPPAAPPRPDARPPRAAQRPAPRAGRADPRARAAACWPTGSASRRSSARSPPACWSGSSRSRGREPNREFLIKLDGIGFGFLVPIFFIATGVAFQLKGLLAPAGGARGGAAVPRSPCWSRGGCPRCFTCAPSAAAGRRRAACCRPPR